MKNVRFIFAVLLVAGLSWSCAKSNPNFDDFDLGEGSTYSGSRQDRAVTQESRRVLIMYSAGFNNLAGYLKEDIIDLTNGYVPIESRNADVLLIVSRLVKNGQYSNPQSPVLIRLTREGEQETKMDTVKVWPAATAVNAPESMREILEYVRDEYPAKSYGMIYSSHGTGWLPSRYYADPSAFEPGGDIWSIGRKRRVYPEIPEYPAVKSLGQDAGTPYAELELKDLAGAIPMHLEYFIVDACLMGGVEFAYEVRNVCDYVAFSQAEVLAEGIDYTKVASHLLENAVPDVQAACQDYFDYYDAQTGSMRSATISMIDCSAMDNLASVCSTLFAKYQTQLHSIYPNAVQRYFRAGRHYFYDLQDILLHCGINAQERMELQTALDRAVTFKAATPRFIDFDINVYSGLSMYLPSDGTDFLNNFYKENISWNDATGLVP